MEETPNEKHRRKAEEITIVTSRKGGVGKSTLSSQLGAALSDRKSDEKTLLIDCDFGVRCLDLLCGVSDKVLFDLGDIAAERIKSERAVIKVRENLHLIASPISEIPSAGQLTDTLEGLLTEYTRIILDTPRDSLERVTEAALKAADRHTTVSSIVVMHPHDMALRAAEITARELVSLGIDEDKRKLVINCFEPDEVVKGRRPSIVELIDRASIPLIGIVPYDSDIAMAQNDGRLAGQLKTANAVQAYRNIAGRVCGENIPLFKGFRLSTAARKKILNA